ncbi:MAG: SDR family oxidoreductase [Trueperaceae bacterium]|nr:SDR family oxidoreductase [Trueperaceae bacterium]
MTTTPTPDTRFDGRVVAITGGAGDIGLATARHLGRQGATVALLDVDAAKLQAATTSLEADGIRASSWHCDVTDESAVDGVVAAITERHGVIRHLFNNAGIQGAFRPVLEYPADDFVAVHRVNVLGAFLVLRAFARHMAANGGGSVVNMASMAAVGGPPNMIAYASSKAAILGMTQVASKDLAPHGIRVNAISPAFMGPGFMWTRQVELQAAAGSQYYDGDPAVVAEQMIGAVPLRRYGSVDEVPAAVAFLLGDGASYITGINVPIAGGIL